MELERKRDGNNDEAKDVPRWQVAGIIREVTGITRKGVSA